MPRHWSVSQLTGHNISRFCNKPRQTRVLTTCCTPFQNGLLTKPEITCFYGNEATGCRLSCSPEQGVLIFSSGSFSLRVQWGGGWGVKPCTFWQPTLNNYKFRGSADDWGHTNLFFPAWLTFRPLQIDLKGPFEKAVCWLGTYMCCGHWAITWRTVKQHEWQDMSVSLTLPLL